MVDAFDFNENESEELFDYMVISQGFIMTLISRMLVMMDERGGDEDEDVQLQQQAAAVASIIYSAIINIIASISNSTEMADEMLKVITETLADKGPAAMADHPARQDTKREFWSDTASAFVATHASLDKGEVVERVVDTMIELDGLELDVYDLLDDAVSSICVASLLIAEMIDKGREADAEPISIQPVMIAMMSSTVFPAIALASQKAGSEL